MKAIHSKSAVAIALLAAAAVSMTACTRPKPSFDTKPAPKGAAPSTRPDTGIGQSTVPGGAAQVAPGSLQDFTVNVGDRVFFDYDSYEIRADAQPILEAQSQWLRRYPAVRVRIEGNADERGTREYNLALGARRANAVRDFLVGRGVTSDRISTISYGKERPIDTGPSEEAHAKNRNAHTDIVSGAR
ncbi:peptidoglycan-associated lipoprotein Pal [Phenylobacterium sp.]|jgi:peptidoglycan-associated lipoprotein|uniref:peptidoglycan-associated lipoprotein Pal n=1 Tax=Phenylobacterium sp. TaxID=1871053 RepID=UPI002F95B9CE